jgi:succinoglycan biosynthesis protein ExoA
MVVCQRCSVARDAAFEQVSLGMVENTQYPFVTVIMPIRNEAHYIQRSLGSVLAQDYPHDRVEVLVVDGMSDDGTREIVQRIADSTSQTPVTLLNNSSRIVPPALNIGLHNARGAIIIRVDGHCEIASTYVRRCVELLQTTGADNVGGLQRAIADGWIARAIALATSSPFGVGSGRFHYADEPGWVDTVYLGAYRREVFDRIGGFDEELVRNQDDEFNFRLTQSGGKIWLDPSIHSVYYSRASLRKLWRQYFEYGFYKVRVIQKRGGASSWRQLVPGAFVLSLLTNILLALVARRKAWALLVAGPYAVANAAASILTARRSPRLLPLLSVTFLTLHFAYGLGFLAGLWRWRKQ